MIPTDLLEPADGCRGERLRRDHAPDESADLTARSGLRLEIAGAGMVTALGSGARETIGALDRGERRIVQTRLVDLRGDRIRGAFALPVRDDLTGAARAELLALPALTECLDSASPMTGPTALFVCAPLPWGSFGANFAPVVAPARDDWTALTGTIAAHLEAHGLRPCSKRPVLIRRGHAAGVLALCHIQKLFERGEAAQAVIVGVDSHGERATLERLDLAGLLKSRRSPGGFVPGEAAAVLCVRPATDDRRGRLVCGIGIDQESEEPSTARGLTSAVSKSLAGQRDAARSLAIVAIDLNGERQRAKEWSFAATRTLWRMRAVPDIRHPADRLGDTGAATVPLFVGLLAHGAKCPGSALAIASSRDGLRGVVRMDPTAASRTG